VRFYAFKGEPRVELTDGVSSIDLSWVDWESIIHASSLEFTHWALTHSSEYKVWLSLQGRLNGSEPAIRRWRWRR
jgi:hypothetical protein